jgi:hypothetical protein
MVPRLFTLCVSLLIGGAVALHADSRAEQFGYLAHSISKAKGDKSATAGSNEDGFYVVMDNYFPKIPSDLPADVKPVVWLNEQDPKDLQWEKSPQPIFFFIPDSWANKADSTKQEEWTAGRAVTIPIVFSYTPPPQNGEDSAPISTDGALLLKVVATFPDGEALLKAYPALKEHGVDESVIQLTDDGTFGFDYAEEGQGEIELASKPLELAKKGESWPEKSQKSALKMYLFFHENFGCFVATAVYQTPQAPQLTSLRAFRDKILLTSESGRMLVGYYYRKGPQWAWAVYQQPARAALIRPFVATAAFAVSHLDLDSPRVQRVLHRIVDLVAWVASPWISENSARGGLRESGEGLVLVPAL